MRRNVLYASALTLGAAALGGRRWLKGGKSSLVEADEAAHSERELFDRGLVDIARSGWTRPEGPATGYPALSGDVSVDVAVIGAGLAGASLALHLAEAGITVAVIETRQPGWGASGRNAGHVLPTLRDRKVFAHFPDKGRRFLEAFRDNRNLPFTIAHKHGIECDGAATGYLTAARSASSIDRLRAQTAWMEDEGLLTASQLSGEAVHKETGTDFWGHGLLFEEGGRINPYRFTNGMIAAAAGLGARIFGDSPAQGIAREGERWRVSTPGGTIEAAKVIFCTGAYADGVVPEFTRAFYPLTAYALTTRPLPEAAGGIILPGQRTFAQAPFDFNPLVRDHDNRLVLSLIPSGQAPEDGEWHFRRHLEWIRRVWPQARDLPIELESYWTGRVGLRDMEFPGAFEMEPGLYGLMHFNAWGNLMAPLMGKLFAEGLTTDRMEDLPFPLTRPAPVANMNKQDRLIRRLLIPAARQAQRWKLL